MIVSELVKQATQCLVSAGFDQQDARLDSEVLIAWKLGRNRSYLFAFSDQAIPPEMTEDILALIAQRCQGVPVAYLTGEKEFWSLLLQCNNSTLIPRPDTESLVELVLTQCHDLPAGTRLADLGTGTGAIALAIASERPDWDVIGVDLESSALALAASNRANLGLNIQLLQSNWLSVFDAASLDIVVSNPPYIDKWDEHLLSGDVSFEPLSALVADQEGLADFINITDQAKRCLRPGGRLFFEHGWQQQHELMTILETAGYADVSGFTDLAGNSRMTSAVWKPGPKG